MSLEIWVAFLLAAVILVMIPGPTILVVLSQPLARALLATSAALLTAFNLKCLVFFVGFLPRFIDPAGDFAIQSAVLVARFVAVAFVNAVAWAALGARAPDCCFAARGPGDGPAGRRRADRRGHSDSAHSLSRRDASYCPP